MPAAGCGDAEARTSVWRFPADYLRALLAPCSHMHQAEQTGPRW